MACVDNVSCPPLSERLQNITFVESLWQWSNAATFVFAAICLFLAKYLYSIPHLLQDEFDARRRRGRRRVERTLRKYERQVRDERRTAAGSFLVATAASRLKRKADLHRSRAAVAPEDAGGGTIRITQPTAAPPADDAAYGGAPTPTVPEAAPEAHGGVAEAMHAVGPDEGSRPAGEGEAPPPDAGNLLEAVQSFVSLDMQLVMNDNSAVALSFTGYALAVCLMLSGPRTPAVAAATDDALGEVISLAQWTATGVGLLFVSAVVVDRAVLRGFAVRGALLTQNVAVGVVELGSYVSCGLVVRALLSGYEFEVPVLESYASLAIYWALGQLAFVVAAFVLQRLTPYSVYAEVAAGNVAAAVQYAANQISAALLITTPLLRSESLIVFATYFGIGTLLLVVVRQLLCRVLIPRQKERTVAQEIVEDRNWGIALVEGAVTVATAMALDPLLPDLPCPGSV